jgi:hypothetical protein
MTVVFNILFKSHFVIAIKLFIVSPRKKRVSPLKTDTLLLNQFQYYSFNWHVFSLLIVAVGMLP